MSRPGEAARAAALQLLQSVLARRRPLDEAIRHEFRPGGRLEVLEARDRAFARLMVATVLRRLGQIDDVLARCLERPLTRRARAVQPILRLAAAQILFLDTAPHAAVDAAVRQAGRYPAFAKLVNAVLRRLAREGAVLAAAQDAARLNCPDWLWRSWSDAYGEATTRAMVEALLTEPPLDLTVKTDAPAWAGRLDARPLSDTGLRRAGGGGAVEDLPGYRQGAWWVQDFAAALPARLLGPLAGRAVLDLCAAPGGKTLQLAAAGARVTAVDRSEARLALLRENLARTGLAAETVAADLLDWCPSGRFELILLDAPCSATGTIRRHPDVWRLKGPEDVAEMAALQRRLVDAALEMLASGGTLVFGTCSLEPAEGEMLAAEVLRAHPELVRRPIRADEIGGRADLIDARGDLRTLPSHLAEEGGIDGFFACRLVAPTAA